MKGFMLASPHSGAGKTLLTMVILRILKQRGCMIAPFKAGPDYIDPSLHLLSCGLPSYNLDPWGMRAQFVDYLAQRAACTGTSSEKCETVFRNCSRAILVSLGPTICSNSLFLPQFLSENRFPLFRNCSSKKLIVEAMMGLFDGAVDGSGTPADLAHQLQLPVVLIVDCTKISHSIAALVSGFHHFDVKTPLRGLILNKVGSARHEQILRQALSKLPIPILGVVHRHDKLVMGARHLGLVLPESLSEFENFINTASQLIAPQLDWEGLEKLADSGKPIDVPSLSPSLPFFPPLGQNIAIARDNAFCFIYPHILDAWVGAGCQLFFFSPLSDESPPATADSIYLPGGYPELYAERLANNYRFKNAMRAAAVAGKRIYGECGGFMVLGEGVEDKAGKTHSMLGLLPLVTSIKTPRLHLGYRQLQNVSDFPLPARARGHEFHYSRILHQGVAQPLFQMRDASGTDLGEVGLVCGRIAGSFIHLIDTI